MHFVESGDISDGFRCLPAGGWSTTTTRCACRSGLPKTWATSTFTADCRAARRQASAASAARRRAAPSSQRQGKEEEADEAEGRRKRWTEATAQTGSEAALGAAASRGKGGKKWRAFCAFVSCSCLAVTVCVLDQRSSRRRRRRGGACGGSALGKLMSHIG